MGSNVERKVDGTNDDCAPVSKIRFKECTSSDNLIFLNCLGQI